MATQPFVLPSNRSLKPLDGALRALFDYAPIGIVLADLDGQFINVNAALRKILEWPDSELAAEARWEDFLEPGQPARNLSWILSGMPAETRAPALQTDALFRTCSGRLIEVQWNLSRAPGEDGRPGFQIGQIADVSRRKQAERKLKELARALDQSNQDLQQFAYAASHDLQEPLRMVRSYLELLARRYQGQLDEDAQEFIGFAVDGAERMQKLISGLLSYSRVGSEAAERQPIPAGESLAAALGNLQVALSESGATVLSYPPELPCVLADPVQLIQLFQNLVANAVKFHGDRAPRVEIRAERQGELWRFAVTDNGIGIDPAFSGRIFQIFQRLEPRKYPGAGIGLALAKRIVERHGGQIGVGPARDGGSEFWFTLPAAPGAPLAPVHEEAHQA